MSEPTPNVEGMAAPAEERCDQCSKLITPTDRVATGGKVFCRSCYASLRAELELAVETMSSGISYPAAVLGAVLGATAGVLAWWGFTVVTKLSLGLLALGIGFAAGWATVRFSGGKRSGGLQAISVAVAAAGYGVATFLVNRTFINRALAEQGESFRVAFPPQSLDLAVKVVSQGFGVMDMVFLAIVIYEAWKIPRPLSLPGAPAA
jgi:hypothetical protein